MKLTDLPVESKRVLVRVDFNVPMDKEQRIADDSRIRASLPTLEYLLTKNASLILMSHLGRPKGKDSKLSLAPIAKRLSEILNRPVLLAPDCIGPDVKKMALSLKDGEILMLENLRFHPEEENPTDDFVKELASLGEAYVNDAFGTAHRAHASTACIARFFPGKKAAGFLMEKEINALKPLLENPSRPFHAIIGGAKISSKAGVIQNLTVEALYIGGAMAIPFFRAQGIQTGEFPVSDQDIDIAKNILKMDKCIYLPLDLVITNGKEIKTVLAKDGIPDLWHLADIGPKTIQAWSEKLRSAKTVFWNGPLGIVEQDPFATGTRAIAQFLATSHSKVIIGGGDSVAAIQQMGLSNKFFHLSTGGGASLEFLEFGHLPGIDALFS